MDALINAAYRQMFFHAFKCDRQPFLESQLRNGQITVRDFIRGLALSPTFYSSFYEKNSNYKFVEHCVQKILGREVYNEREKIAWSITVANKGIQGLVDALLDSEEYLTNFGYNTVPYQRRRVLPGKSQGDLPIHISNPRYDAYHRNQLGFPRLCGSLRSSGLCPKTSKLRQATPASSCRWLAASVPPAQPRLGYPPATSTSPRRFPTASCLARLSRLQSFRSSPCGTQPMPPAPLPGGR